MSTTSYTDTALILTWPDATIRGDEAWMMFFKKIGIVKNLNFKVGHTGIVIINNQTGKMLFYDFGRYITPRGHGRARSAYSDPRLEIKIVARFKDNKIENLDEIISHFEQLKDAMYGSGRLLFSTVEGINFEMAKSFGDQWVNIGTYPYGAVARNNNNCSRFITRMLIKSSEKFHFWHKVNIPETIKSSPVSNLVNSTSDGIIYSYLTAEGIKPFKMNRWQSLFFLIKQLGDNVTNKKASQLPNDQIIGAMTFSSKPISIPKNAQYLGGVGDGAWYYALFDKETNQFTIKRYTSQGNLEYVVLGSTNNSFDPHQKWEISYDSHLIYTTIIQNGIKIKVEHIAQLPLEDHRFDHIQERYA